MKNPWLLTAYALTFSFAVNAQVASDTKHSTLPFRYSVVPAPEWNDLFKRSHGWFGADGTFSVPLSGIDKNNNVDNDSTLLLFSDTFVGEVKDGQPLPGYAMVNNSIAYLKGNDPDPKNIRFFYKSGLMASRYPFSFRKPRRAPDRNCSGWVMALLTGNWGIACICLHIKSKEPVRARLILLRRKFP